MLNEIKKKIEDFTKKYPKWDEIINNQIDTSFSGISEEEEVVIDKISGMFNDIISVIKKGGMQLDELDQVFEGYACKEFAINYIRKQMKDYYEYDVLRNLAKSDIYKAKGCIDLIWSSYILRFNPYLEFNGNIPLSEKNYINIAKKLEGLINFCIKRSFSEIAIRNKLNVEIELPEALSDYIVEKIEQDYEKLRLNYIIYKLSTIEDTLDDYINE